MEETTETAPAQRPANSQGLLRFSILSLLGMTALFALVVALFAMIGERAKWKEQTLTLREEVRQLREANELLDVVDPKKIYVRAMASPFPRMGQWRVHLPKGSDYRLKYDWKDLPPDRDPHHVYRPYSGMKIPTGTYTIAQTFQFTPATKNSEWHVNITVSGPGFGGRVRHGLPVDAPSWLVANEVSKDQFQLPPLSDDRPSPTISFRATGAMLNTPQSEFDANEEVVLFKYEAHAAPPKHEASSDLLPQEVFRLWIEKEPDQSIP
ncbi:hypothetical protein ACYFX5_21905 [Bremerella sp. T1]|uniref:hypothetical protein n=1 Tax=Bremerella sp. TYQ1 TaxID=3119568 RepID=UPI001CD0104B|nr:hypothetical protein [Bremerella volcania]UBM35695.1 hypothetical protein LA756_23845 [Bremerella volcania]